MLDTVGFITDLPHGLVDSFKATLDEVLYADVIVHVRDISHPHTEHQRETVLRVLSEIGVSSEQISKKYIELWNKIDLVEDRDKVEEDYLQKLDDFDGGQNYPIVMMSCKTGENKVEFLDKISEMASELMGKKYYLLEYPCEEH